MQIKKRRIALIDYKFDFLDKVFNKNKEARNLLIIISCVFVLFLYFEPISECISIIEIMSFDRNELNFQIANLVRLIVTMLLMLASVWYSNKNNTLWKNVYLSIFLGESIVTIHEKLTFDYQFLGFLGGVNTLILIIAIVILLTIIYIIKRNSTTNIQLLSRLSFHIITGLLILFAYTQIEYILLSIFY